MRWLRPSDSFKNYYNNIKDKVWSLIILLIPPPYYTLLPLKLESFNFGESKITKICVSGQQFIIIIHVYDDRIAQSVAVLPAALEVVRSIFTTGKASF